MHVYIHEESLEDIYKMLTMILFHGIMDYFIFLHYTFLCFQLG